ncbi:uracil-DNA glycosylase [uncultured Planktomarina sp.]|uniref:uracil-DNA glycosylase n=1 Tax=uncultured Planktomarina sp. TaxID=1538529 RepID=UPI0032600297
MDQLDWHMARAALQWQAELGVSDAVCDAPIDRYEVLTQNLKPSTVAATPAGAPHAVDPVAVAEVAAAAAGDLPALKLALQNFSHCDLRRGARNLVFGGGAAGARVMILEDAPGRAEDLQGLPFAGPAGQLLDKMFVAIGLNRAEEVYAASVIPWRPPQDREASSAEIAMMQPFARRHIILAAPQVVICVGNISCQAVLGKRGLNKLRGAWQEGFALPVLPMVHPQVLLRQPARKKQAWQDLLMLKAWLHAQSEGGKI